MKILHITSTDGSGGADRAAMRLHKALTQNGINSTLLVQNKSSDDESIVTPYLSYRKVLGTLRVLLDRLLIRHKIKTKELFSVARLNSPSTRKLVMDINPDIVHVHWMAKGMLSLRDLEKINKPMVWSLHDMWAFTGGCHYDENCSQHQKGCGNCPMLKSPSTRDRSYRHFKRKKKFFTKFDEKFRIVGLSKWIQNQAQQSEMFAPNEVVNIPNAMDTSAFKPLDQDTARNILNLPMDQKIVLFGSMGSNSSPRKGFNQLSEAADKLNLHDTILCIIGSSKANVELNDLKVQSLGSFKDEVSLSIVYSAADVLVVPSLQENLSNMILECLSCNTPVVAFDIGGNPDMIGHKKNGYLAKPFDSEDLAQGIQWTLENKHAIGEQPRSTVHEKFDQNVVTPEYIKLYENLLQE